MKQQQKQNVEAVLATRWHICEKERPHAKWKMEETQLQKQRLEAESKKEEHQDLMQVMLQQTKQQQEQIQNFQMMFTLM